MCTVNSLAEVSQRLYHVLSHGVAMLILVIFSTGNSSAHPVNDRGDCNSLLNFIVTAPPDITITIRDTTSCDTTIVLPPAACIGCVGGEQFSTRSVFATLNSNGGLMNFHTGSYDVIYTISNTAGMVGRDTMRVTIFDNDQPNAVCKSRLNIFINNTGEAEIPASLLDEGSSDNCSHIYFKAKRMFAPSGFICNTTDNPGNSFDDELKFCCPYLDSPEVMVRLRIYDAYPGDGPVSESFLFGHFVECMVRIQILDKLPPEVVCPLPVTIHCGADIDSALNAGHIAVFDNCSILEIDTLTRYQLNNCGVGKVERTFTATDQNGLQNSCVQQINITGISDFDGLDPNQLQWPAHQTVYACRISLNEIPLIEPVIVEDECNNVVSYFKDEVYQFSRGGVCAKILRVWEVIDWCKYNHRISNPHVASNGYYTYTQEIKILDTIAPLISGLNDTTIAILSDQCSPGFAVFNDLSADDCGSTDHIRMWFEIDFFEDGTIDKRINGFNPSGIYPHGKHLIKVYASDSCHNEALKKIHVTIKDGKKPNAKILYGISTNISQMPNGNMVSINARLFDEGSTDNCTPSNRLRFSFSDDINDTIKVFDCSQLNRNDIGIYVWDECLNYTLAITYLVVTDIHQLCPTTIQTVTIDGTIHTYSNVSVPEVKLVLNANQVQHAATTDKNGKYAFYNIPMNTNISVHASETQDHLRGITTADLAQIQRHILNGNTLQSPYLLLAADANQNGQITTQDIALLRALLLGKVAALPGGDAYIFINKDYVFANPQLPFDEYIKNKDISIGSLDHDMKLNWMAVKLGDVNASATYNGLHDYSSSIPFYIEAEGNYINIKTATSVSLRALQFGLNLNQIGNSFLTFVNSELTELNSDHIFIENNKLRLAFSSDKDINLNKGSLIARFKIKKETNLTSVKAEQEFLSELLQADGKLAQVSWIENPSKDEPYFINLYPNPANHELFLDVYSSGAGTLFVECMTLEGKRIDQLSYNITEKNQRIEFPTSALHQQGVYMLKCKWNDKVLIQKLIVNK